MSVFHTMRRTALTLSVFAAVTTGMVAGMNALTADRIEASRKQELTRSLNAIVPAASYDNLLLEDTLTLQDKPQLGHDQPETVWRARLRGQPVAVLLPVIAPDGYSGRIRLLVGIHVDGTLAAVRVLSHRETPGLGDAIETAKSDWILGFSGKSLTQAAGIRWRVRKDGGDFDQFTGATITPRAVVKAVHNALLYYQDHRDALFAPTPTEVRP